MIIETATRPHVVLSEEEKCAPQFKTGYRHDPRAQDKRDANYPVKPALMRAAQPVIYKYWTGGPLLDQGSKPHCVEFGGRGFLSGSPIRQDHSKIPQKSIYDWCQEHDEWAGTDYDGTSVHALMKWLKENGYISSYEWAKTVEELHAHITMRGVAVVGTTWTQDMSYVDEFNFARFTGANWGGHCHIIKGSNRTKKDPVTGKLGVFKNRNSWGLSYADKGEALITWADMQNLIDDYGEIALPIEIKRAA